MDEDRIELSTAEIFNTLNTPHGNAERCVRLYAELARRGEYLEVGRLVHQDKEEIYFAPQIMGFYISTLISENRKNKRILDVGAGTGYLSRELRKHGFENIDGLDATEEMLKIAREKNLYTNYMCEFLTEQELNIEKGIKPCVFVEFLTEQELDIEKETYDIVAICSALGGGHIPVGALHELIRILKSGGYCCFNVREELLETWEEYEDFEDLLDEIEKESKWRKIERKKYPNHIWGKTGVLFCYQKL